MGMCLSVVCNLQNNNKVKNKKKEDLESLGSKDVKTKVIQNNN